LQSSIGGLILINALQIYSCTKLCAPLKKLQKIEQVSGGNSLVISRVDKLKIQINWTKNVRWKGDAV
jgi:hypothetical protein